MHECVKTCERQRKKKKKKEAYEILVRGKSERKSEVQKSKMTLNI